MTDKGLPCPHGRISMDGVTDGWRHCPHCNGWNVTSIERIEVTPDLQKRLNNLNYHMERYSNPKHKNV